MNIMKKLSLFFVLVLTSLFYTGCKYDFILPPYEPPVIDNGGNTEPISFATQVAPILMNDKCTSCHKPGGLGSPDLSNSATLYSKLVPLVNTTDPESSVLYTKASSGSHYAKVTSAQAKLILQWIKEGANNN
jgi:hypothetical protein